jgi:hypothetical protein
MTNEDLARKYVDYLNEGMERKDFSKAIEQFAEGAIIIIDSRTSGKWRFDDQEKIKKFHQIFLQHPPNTRFVITGVQDILGTLILSYQISSPGEKTATVQGRLTFEFNKEGKIRALTMHTE